MAQPFSFGFSGDDIEQDPNEEVQAQEVQTPGTATAESNNDGVPPPIPARTHDLDDLLATLPSKLSFTTLPITSPTKSLTKRLPRRELFDVRLQLMAEDDSLDPSSSSSDNNNKNNPLVHLNTSTDLTPNIYEGGYKTWECSFDLCRFLLDRGPRKDLDDMARVNHVIELGCGTALPSLLLFQYVLRNRLVGCYFTLSDYNEDVLRCVTLPNLFLAWVGCLGEAEGGRLFDGEEGNPVLKAVQGRGEEEEGGELYVTPDLIAAFKSHLSSLGLTLTLISGSWLPVPTLLSLVPSSPDLNTLILGSETIYSPSSLEAFTQVMAALMKRVRSGKAIVAAKRVYFGVGGSVDGFRAECSNHGCVGYEIDFEGLEGGSQGVRRCLVEVQTL